MKDRHSRTGMQHKSEFERKGGAGAHNWGSFNDEENLRYQGDMDAQLESAMFPADDDTDKSSVDQTGQSPSDSMSSLDSAARPITGRRMSQVSDQERADALRYREGGLKQKGVDLASIARTSHGVAQSPTNESVLSTSPLRTKVGFSLVRSTCLAHDHHQVLPLTHSAAAVMR